MINFQFLVQHEDGSVSWEEQTRKVDRLYREPRIDPLR